MRENAPRAIALAVLSAFFVGACQGREDRREQRAAQPSAATSVPRCDSARAASVAIDSLSRLNQGKSEVYRYEPDSAGVRIVTWPVWNHHLTDGMAAIIRIDRACRIVSLIQVDSA